MSGIFARKIEARDFTDFSFVIAMDNENLATLIRLCPRESSVTLALLSAFSSYPANTEVPDLYYGTFQDFEYALDLIEAGAVDLLRYLNSEIIPRLDSKISS
jgi:protein-tyrosine phosphatase